MTKYHNESLRRGLCVLATVAAAPQPLGVTETAELSGLDYSTTYRLLMTLAELGYLERDKDTKRYRAASATLRLGYSYLQNNPLHRMAVPVMRELLAATGETVNLSVRGDSEMILLESCETGHLLGTRRTRNGRFPLHCTASGKVILAWLPEEELLPLLDRLELQPLTPRTSSDRASLLASLQQVRRQGWALNDEEHVAGLVAVAVPIFDRAGKVVAALDIPAPTVRVTAAQAVASFLQPLRDSAGRLSAALGWNGEDS